MIMNVICNYLLIESRIWVSVSDAIWMLGNASSGITINVKMQNK